MVNPGLLSLATPREAQEMDISLLLESPNWLEDECELDIMNLNKDIDTLDASSFLLIQASSDKYVFSTLLPVRLDFQKRVFAFYRNILSQANNIQNYATPSSPQPGIAGQSGRGASVVSFILFSVFY